MSKDDSHLFSSKILNSYSLDGSDYTHWSVLSGYQKLHSHRLIWSGSIQLSSMLTLLDLHRSWIFITNHSLLYASLPHLL